MQDQTHRLATHGRKTLDPQQAMIGYRGCDPINQRLGITDLGQIQHKAFEVVMAVLVRVVVVVIIILVIMVMVVMIFLNAGKQQEFVYFQF